MDTAAVGSRDADLLDRLSGWRFGALAFILTRAALTLVGIAGVAILGEGGRRLDLAPDLPWLELWAQ